MVNHISKTAFYHYKVVVENGRSYAVCLCVCLSTGCNTSSSSQHETPYSVFLSITIGDIDCIINPLIFQRVLPFFKKVSNCFRGHQQGKLQPFSMFFSHTKNGGRYALVEVYVSSDPKIYMLIFVNKFSLCIKKAPCKLHGA